MIRTWTAALFGGLILFVVYYLGILTSATQYLPSGYVTNVLINKDYVLGLLPAILFVASAMAVGIRSLPFRLWQRAVVAGTLLFTLDMTLGVHLRDMRILEYRYTVPQKSAGYFVAAQFGAWLMIVIQSRIIERLRYTWPRPVDMTKRSDARGY